ncbi:beta-galactosidase trimerization domain-containing protein [Streptomyces sp. NPDC087859]|uniref:beta-galactosidase trimerization domain-containing protein n=1 Tax=Streptomyces sp. NPDC087859 TaxID=3365812 RepID=UPI0037FF607A
MRAAGVRYDEFSNLHTDLPLRTAPDGSLQLPGDAVATRWAEGLAVEDADVLAEYDHPYFGRWPAVTTRRHGAGRVTCVGTAPTVGASMSFTTGAGSRPPPRPRRT